MEPNQTKTPQENNDNQASIEPSNDGSQILKHERVLAPLDSSLKAEGLITPVKPTATPNTSTQSLPMPTQTTQLMPSNSDAIYPNPAQPANSTPPQTEKFNNGAHRALKIIRYVITGLIGFFLTGAYYTYWDGSFINQGILALKHYSPLILINTVIPTIVIGVIYGLVLRFILRSQRAFAQSFFAIISSQLIVVGLLGILHLHDQSVNIFASPVTTIFTLIAALLGALIFIGANYLSNKVWTWNISRSTIGVGTLVALIAIVFGLSQTVGVMAAKEQRKEKEASAAQQAQAAQGVYNFDGGYQQFYPNDTALARFDVSKLSATDLSKVKGWPKDAPHLTEFKLLDKNNDRLEFTMYETAANKKAFDPPSLCNSPDPGQWSFQLGDTSSPYIGKCTEVANIPGVGTLYGHDQGDEFTNIGNDEEVQARAKGNFTQYYIQHDNTLITLKDIQGQLGKDGAVALVSNLTPISSADLLSKSKQSADNTSNNTSAQSLGFSVYTPSNTMGSSLNCATITNKTDPENLVLLLGYGGSGCNGSYNISVHEFKRPSKFSPPYCGYEAPGLGAPETSCKLVGQTTSGKNIYYAGWRYWGDFGDTIITMDFAQAIATSKTDAIGVYSSFSEVSANSLNLQ